MAARIKKDDVVYIRTGAHKGKTGKVLRLTEDSVIIEGINLKWKHLKPTQTNQRGGRIQKEAKIHISNVQPVDPKTGKGTRVKVTITNGEKHRTAVKTGTSLGIISKV